MMMMLVLLVALASARCIYASGDIIFTPVKHGGQEIALLLVQAPEVKPTQYIPLAQSLQNTSNYSLWIGIPENTFDVVLSFEIDKGIDRILSSMKAKGMNSSTIFFAAHSSLSSGAVLQDYLIKNQELASGLILMGGFLQRNKRDVPYPIHTLMISGELDGVCRVSRMMEEYYHRIYLRQSDWDAAVIKYHVITVRGMTHFQFASGEVPNQIKELDFKPEISYDEAHKTVARIISAFVAVSLGDKSSSIAILSDAMKNTGDYFQPLIDAYSLEGNYYFNPPCNDNPPSAACQLGSPWTVRAMTVMADPLDLGHVNDTDEFHPAAQVIPTYHHPKIFSKCSKPDPSCVVKLSSVSENIYKSDKGDSGLVPNSASEIRAKLKSRQSVLLAAGYSNVDFNTSDAGSRCKTINQLAYDWAVNHTDPMTRIRFREFGVPMVMGEDKGCLENGGLWIYLPMHYNTTKNSTGGEILLVQSIQLKTNVTYPIGIFAGMHFCKLLTPARAMEWIYVDSLRAYYTLAEHQPTKVKDNIVL
jgi:predicted esterase